MHCRPLIVNGQRVGFACGAAPRRRPCKTPGCANWATKECDYLETPGHTGGGVMSFRVSAEEYAAGAAVAERLGISIGELARRRYLGQADAPPTPARAAGDTYRVVYDKE